MKTTKFIFLFLCALLTACTGNWQRWVDASDEEVKIIRYDEVMDDFVSLNSYSALMRLNSDRGGRIFAECGGFMLLSESITLSDGIKYPMAGVFPIECTMEGARLHLGYRQADYHGIRMRGHEFHYSKISTKVPHLSASESDGLDSCGKMTSEVIQYNARGEATDTSLFRYKNTLAGSG